MKAFFVLCSTLSVLQVIFIGESTAQNEDYKDYIDNVGSYLGNNRITNRGMLNPASFGYDMNTGINNMYDVFGNAMDVVKTGANRGISNLASLGDNMNNGANNIMNEVFGNDAINVLKTGSNRGISNLASFGDDIYNGVNNIAYDVFGNPIDVVKTGAKIPRHLSKTITGIMPNFLSFNNNNQYEGELANGRRLPREYIPNEMYPMQNKYQPRRQYPSQSQYLPQEE